MAPPSTPGPPALRFRTLCLQITGMPDYAAYLERAVAAKAPRLTEREFYDEHLRNRYADGGFRCC